MGSVVPLRAMDTLFTAMENDRKRDVAPLAVRMRPRTLDEVVGQAEAVGEGSWLRAAIENDTLSSVILFGPAGTGKTSLCAGIASCLAMDGLRVLCIDLDVGLRNLDIALGMAEQPAVAFTDVTQGFCKLSDAAEHPALPGLFLLTAPVREQDALVEQVRCCARPARPSTAS